MNSQSITIEQCSRVVFHRLGWFKTIDGVKSLVDRNKLNKAPGGAENRRYSKYAFKVNVGSLVSYLRENGFNDEEIKGALPEGVEMI